MRRLKEIRRSGVNVLISKIFIKRFFVSLENFDSFILQFSPALFSNPFECDVKSAANYNFITRHFNYCREN